MITDRLHGHVLALLMGIPHVVLPNTNGPDQVNKIDAFLDTWTGGLPGVARARTPDEALDVARRLVAERTAA